MIRELEKVLEEVKPGARRKASHLRIIARALKPIANIQAGSGIKITRSRDKITVELA